MAVRVSIVLLILAIIECFGVSVRNLKILKNLSMNDFPLTKSLGFSLDSKLSKQLEDAMFNQGFLEQYKKVVRASRESFESLEDNNPKKIEKKINLTEHGIYGVPKRRRSAQRFHSEAGRRRARSQALRRDKLISQSLRSHLSHSRQSTLSDQELWVYN